MLQIGPSHAVGGKKIALAEEDCAVLLEQEANEASTGSCRIE